jgi:hypothetical protein
MRYRVAFTKRVQPDGLNSAMHPSAELDANVAEGIVAEKVFVEQLETDAQHSQEVLDEDDDFLASAAPEVWEYEVVDDRAREFEEALSGSDLVLEYDVVDNTVTSDDEVARAVTSENTVYPPDEAGAAEISEADLPVAGPAASARPVPEEPATARPRKKRRLRSGAGS